MTIPKEGGGGELACKGEDVDLCNENFLHRHNDGSNLEPPE
jgi:hypothetical protein